MNRKRMILAALLGVLALCVLYAYLATPRLEKAPPRTAGKPERQAVTKASMEQQKTFSQDRIDFSFMDAETEEFPGAVRDVFRFGQRRPQATDIPVTQADEPKPPVIIDIPPAEEVIPFEVIHKALSQFTFLGFLDKAGEKTVFLSSAGSLFLAKQGEKFGADLEFTVEDISEKLLRVRHNGREGLIEIPLIEQQKLNASVSAPARLPAATPISQPQTGAFNPNRRLLRPAAPQGSEADIPGTIEENNPEEVQEVDLPVEGDDSEGEANGSNQ
jgi:hypothetical protein